MNVTDVDAVTGGTGTDTVVFSAAQTATIASVETITGATGGADKVVLASGSTGVTIDLGGDTGDNVVFGDFNTTASLTGVESFVGARARTSSRW